MNNPSSHSSGFTLIEVLASIAILTVIALGVAKVSRDMAKTSVGTHSVQQRTNLEQSLTAAFENSEICTTILAGRTSAEGTQVTLPPSVQSTDEVLSKIKLDSITLTDILSLSNDNYRAVLVAAGHKNSAINETFTAKIPVYYAVSGSTILNCYSSRSAYSTCMALNGIWKDTYCDFCDSMGGMRLADGSCSLARAPAAATPAPVPTTTPGPPTRYTLITSASDRNGVRTHSIAGNYKQCNLINYSYDGDGIGQCTMVNNGGGSWGVTIGDEGTAQVQVCYMVCVDTSVQDMGGTEDGDLCTANGKPGIRMNGCCATGTTFELLFTTPSGKNSSPLYTGTNNDIGCF